MCGYQIGNGFNAPQNADRINNYTAHTHYIAVNGFAFMNDEAQRALPFNDASTLYYEFP